jgi:hypothetical protein
MMKLVPVIALLLLVPCRGRSDTLTQVFEIPLASGLGDTIEFFVEPVPDSFSELSNIQISLDCTLRAQFTWYGGAASYRGEGHCIGGLQVALVGAEGDSTLWLGPFHLTRSYDSSQRPAPTTSLTLDISGEYGAAIGGPNLEWWPFVTGSGALLRVVLVVDHAYAFSAPSNYGGSAQLEWSGTLQVTYTGSTSVHAETSSWGEVKALYR